MEQSFEVNKLLAKQLKRSKITTETEMSEKMLQLLKYVSQSYDHFQRDRKLLERAMDLSSAEIRESYGQIAVQNELERSNKELQQFVSVASHDLKAPLRTIGSFIGIIEKSLAGKLDEKTGMYMGFVTDGVKQMADLIDSLLQYAQMEGSVTQKEEVDLANALSIVLKNLNFAIGESCADIEITGDFPCVEAIPSQVMQLFQNIVGNAIKYRRDEPLKIKIHSEVSKDGHLISINDNGMGMRKEQYEKAFQPFTRLEGGLKVPGHGLGLSICKKVVNNWNGKIWIESEEGVGTTFFFTIPQNSCDKKEIKITEEKVVDLYPYKKDQHSVTVK